MHTRQALAAERHRNTFIFQYAFMTEGVSIDTETYHIYSFIYILKTQKHIRFYMHIYGVTCIQRVCIWGREDTETYTHSYTYV